MEAKREALPNARQRNAPDASGRLTSFSVEGVRGDKNTSAGLCAKNARGGGGIFAGHYGNIILIHRPEEGLNLKCECILVRSCVEWRSTNTSRHIIVHQT